MKFILLVLVALFSISIVSADYTIGSGGSLWDGNSTMDNVTERDTGNVVVGVFDDTATRANDPNTIGWRWINPAGANILNNQIQLDSKKLIWAGNISASDSDYNISFTLNTSTSYKYNIVFYANETAIEHDDTWSGYYLELETSAGRQQLFYNNGTTHTAVGTLGLIALPINSLYMINTSTVGTGLNLSKDGSVIWTCDTGNSSYTSGHAGFWNTRATGAYLDDINVKFQDTGNITVWNDSGAGNEIYKYDVNATGNYSFYQGNNSTGVLVQEGGIHNGNQTITVSSGTRYQNADARVNISDGELISITFYEQASSGSVDITYYNTDYDNLTANCLINISNKVEPLSTINLTWIGNLSSEYCLLHPNGTAVQACVAATYEGEIIWFNGSDDRLPEATNYSINETISVDTKFEYYNGTGWQEGESEYYLWFTCFWWTAECANEEQSDSQATLKITNNGTASGIPKMKLNESAPAGIKIYVDDDNTFAGAVELNNTYQAVSTSLAAGNNITCWSWAYLYGAPAWEFETYAIVE